MRTIDADKLVDMLYDNEFAVLCPLDEVSGVVDACPTVNADLVVEAKWIPRDEMLNYPRIPYRYNRHYCSACEQPAVAYEHNRYDVEEFLTPRCPECGAYMLNGE